MSAARRVLLAPGELELLAGLLALALPPAFAVRGASGVRRRLVASGVLVGERVHASVAAGLQAACGPQLGVLVEAPPVTAALGVRGDVGGSLARTGDDLVEASLWPAVALDAELARLVPAAACRRSLRATVVAPPKVVGQCLWFARDGSWRRLSLDGSAHRVGPPDLGPALAPLIGAGLA